MQKEVEILGQKCKKMLDEDGVRFIGIINNMGRQIAGGYKEGITPFVDEQKHKMGIQHALAYILTKDLDESLGPVDYMAAKREKVVMITIPLKEHIVLLSTEHNTNTEEIIEKITKLQLSV